MKETRTINLNGMAYHIDYDAYQLLREYISDIELRLPMDTRPTVVAELESRIADIFQQALYANNVQVVNIAMVEAMKTQVGAPSEFGENRRPKTKVEASHTSGCRRTLRVVFNVLLALLALPVIIVGVLILLAMLCMFFGVAVASTTSVGALMALVPVLTELTLGGAAVLIPLLFVALLAIVLLPVVVVIYAIVTYLRTRRGPKARFWIITMLLWIASVCFCGAAVVRLYESYSGMPEIMKMMSLHDLDLDEEGVGTTSLQLDAYHSVQLSGAAKLRLSSAATPSTTLTTNMDHMLDDHLRITVNVKDSVLYIDVPTTIPGQVVDFGLALPELRRLTILGASKIETLDGATLITPSLLLDISGAAEVDMRLMVEELVVDAKGASKLELDGSATRAQITIAGAGKLDAEDLVVEKMQINCAGASLADVNVTGELKAQASGASKISYSGGPTVKQKLAVGGSTIVKD
jgi:hypothetical protein